VRRFDFRLEQVRRWRELQRDQEEARLQALLAEFRRLETAGDDLAHAAALAEQSVRPTPDAPLGPMQELQALDSYRAHVRREFMRLANLRSRLDARINTQRRALLEAERKLEVLDTLRQERLAEWKKELDKEQEELVAELVVARWAQAG